MWLNDIASSFNVCPWPSSRSVVALIVRPCHPKASVYMISVRDIGGTIVFSRGLGHTVIIIWQLEEVIQKGKKRFL